MKNIEEPANDKKQTTHQMLALFQERYTCSKKKTFVSENIFNKSFFEDLRCRIRVESGNTDSCYCEVRHKQKVGFNVEQVRLECVNHKNEFFYLY